MKKFTVKYLVPMEATLLATSLKEAEKEFKNSFNFPMVGQQKSGGLVLLSIEEISNERKEG